MDDGELLNLIPFERNLALKAFLEFVLGHYVSEGVRELDQESLPLCFASATTTPSPTPSPTWDHPS